MIHIDRVIQITQDFKPHDYKIVALGSEYRHGGYIFEMNNAVITSTYHEGTLNLQCIDSGETRKVHSVLIIEFDGVEVFI